MSDYTPSDNQLATIHNLYVRAGDLIANGRRHPERMICALRRIVSEYYGDERFLLLHSMLVEDKDNGQKYWLMVHYIDRSRPVTRIDCGRFLACQEHCVDEGLVLRLYRGANLGSQLSLSGSVFTICGSSNRSGTSRDDVLIWDAQDPPEDRRFDGRKGDYDLTCGNLHFLVSVSGASRHPLRNQIGS
jgi:hypothetical protein